MLVGPSGCGKSTLLRMIAGLEDITGGEIAIDGEVVNDLPPRDRDIAMVFQSYALYPHMTVYENMAFALQLAKVPQGRDRPSGSTQAAEHPAARALSRPPAAAALGRPAAARRHRPRHRARAEGVPVRRAAVQPRRQAARRRCGSEIAQLQQRLDVTMIYVTHDQVEAMTLADRIVVMHDGRAASRSARRSSSTTSPPTCSSPASSARRR